MPRVKPNSFQTYELTERESLEGAVLNPIQEALLQNVRFEITNQKLSLTPDSLTPEGKESYWQQEAYLRGQLQIIEHLLASSQAAIAALQELDADQPLTTFDTAFINSSPI